MNFPTPIEVARGHQNWISRSQQFFSAGQVLLEEYLQAVQQLHDSVDKVIGEEDTPWMMRLHSSSAIIFLLAFSIELLVKAILVKQDPQRWIPDHGKMKFNRHNVFDLITREIKLDLNEDESQIVKRIGDYVSWGKYPERVSPGDVNETLSDMFSYHPHVSWSLHEFFEIIAKLRTRLLDVYDSN